MNKSISIALALFAGILGGLIARYAAPPSAHAQEPAPVTKEIRAQSFTLVDSSNRVVGVFTSEPASRGAGRGSIVLRDWTGREIWSAGGSGIRPATER